MQKYWYVVSCKINEISKNAKIYILLKFDLKNEETPLYLQEIRFYFL